MEDTDRQEQVLALEECVDVLEQQLSQRDSLVVENQRLVDEKKLGVQARLDRLKGDIKRHHEEVANPNVPICGAMSPYQGLLEHAGEVIKQEGESSLKQLLR